MFNFLAVCAIALSAAVPSSHEVTIRNVRPSRVLAQLVNAQASAGGRALVWEATGGSGSLLPAGIKVRADDKRSVLVIEGDKRTAEEVERFAALFDVSSRTVHLQMRVVSTLDKYENDVLLKPKNNSSVSWADSLVGIQASVAPRINEDGTITMFVSFKQDDSPGTDMVVRMKPDQLAAFGPKRGTPEGEKDAYAGFVASSEAELWKNLDSELGPVLIIRPTLPAPKS